MSLQHDVKRYTIRCMEDEQHYGIEVESATGDYVAFTDYEAVRGEVERLTAENNLVHCAERRALNECAYARRQEDRARERAETAEASLRSLRDALEKKWIPVTERLPESGQKFLGYDKYFDFGTGTFTTDEDEASENLNAYSPRNFRSLGITHWMPLPVPPAAPDSTKSTESTAARKSNDWTTPTTDAARKEE